jgi:hypothetical protein
MASTHRSRPNPVLSYEDRTPKEEKWAVHVVAGAIGHIGRAVMEMFQTPRHKLW